MFGPGGKKLARWLLQGPGRPDLAVVDEVARLALLGARIGGKVVLTEVAPPLRDLLELSGLGVEMEGQSELGEEPIRIEGREEEAHPGDLPP